MWITELPIYQAPEIWSSWKFKKERHQLQCM